MEISHIFLLLLMLFLCHYIGDFSQLSTPRMLAAKRYGSDIEPILEHALVHGVLFFSALMAFTSFFNALSYGIIQFCLHALIDYGKGRITWYFYAFRDNTKPPFWYLFGFDQLLHYVVILLIVYSIAVHG